MATRAQKAQGIADAWNAAHPEGTLVKYWRGRKSGEPSGTGATRSPAEARGDDAVVFITGCSGFVCLSHVEVV
ncbi:MAG: hypothetical protein Q8S73_24550 [Deltaproteobacteria bacterium]|nr:hypothetical protein [Myxococcales bacterium]MDP3217305.1 hypothetical protein [Deltaproteobacteria bacterium]